MSPRTIAWTVSLVTLLTPAAATTAPAREPGYNYVTPGDLKARLLAGDSLFILDIQVPEEFAAHHIRGAVPTYAYPVKGDADRAKLDAVLEGLRSGGGPVVIVCPRGGGGARRAYDHLKAAGIPEERLLILEGGQSGWPYPDLVQGE